MYYTDDSILPENMAPLIITAAPYGPAWLPGDADIPVTWDEQVQAAVDCYNAGATMLHVHVRDLAADRPVHHFQIRLARREEHRISSGLCDHKRFRAGEGRSSR